MSNDNADEYVYSFLTLSFCKMDFQVRIEFKNYFMISLFINYLSLFIIEISDKNTRHFSFFNRYSCQVSFKTF